jgi:hypothetical protein
VPAVCGESHAFGVLGQQGRGACEAAGLQPGQVSGCAQRGALDRARQLHTGSGLLA